MRRSVLLSSLVLLAGFREVCADELDDEYVRIYNLIQQADSRVAGGEWQTARGSYLEAQRALQSLQKGRPDWNPQVVQFRLRYVAEKLQPLSAEAPPKPEPGENPKLAPPVAEESTNQLKLLQLQVRQLTADRELIQARLKEALLAQPAAVDPRELQKAEDRIRTLEKELALLRVNLRKADSESTPHLDLKKQIEQLQADIAEYKSRNEILLAEKKILESRLNELASLKEREPKAKERALAKELSDAKGEAKARGATMVALQAELKRLREEKASLEQANRELASQSAAAKSSAQTARRLGSSNTRAESADARRIRELEAQRDELQRMFSAVTRDLHDQKSRGQMQVAYAEQLTNQLAIFRARLQVLEAPKVPYSADEITLLRMPELKLPKSDGQNYLEPAGEVTAAAELAAEAGRAFNARRLDEAQKKYEQVLNMAKRNVGILGNLAAVQIQLNHLAEAEKTLRQALAESPKDAFSLSLLGVIRVRQKKYDEALESLSRSAQLDPKNAETHHYLGIVLAEKGLRAPAEAAFRRAIELSPGHAGAHHNLAVVYVTQKPPALELARWHYQKALAGGHTRNPELENALNGKRSTAAMK